MCIGARESTTNSRSSGFFEEGAGITHASRGQQNVALFLFLNLETLFSKSHAPLRAHLYCCKVSSCVLSSKPGGARIALVRFALLNNSSRWTFPNFDVVPRALGEFDSVI